MRDLSEAVGLSTQRQSQPAAEAGSILWALLVSVGSLAQAGGCIQIGRPAHCSFLRIFLSFSTVYP